jgi:hypothetical protein
MYGFLELLREKKLNEFNYNLLNEGLIMSVDYVIFISKMNDILKKYNINGYCDLYIGKDRVILKIDENHIYKRKIFFQNLSNLLNQTGYFVSNYKINDDKLEIGDIDISLFIKNSNLLLYLNKRFDSESGYIPEFLFHVTENKYLDKITKQGIINKSKKYIENHPERIYLFSNLENCYDYIDFKELSDFIILKIDVKTLKNIKLYDDPKYQPTINAYYTYDNIQPFSIEIIKQN